MNTSSERQYFIKIIGRCKSKICGNVFSGFCNTEPPVTELCIRVKTRDTKNQMHEILHRPLNGEKRKLLGKEAITEGYSNLRKRIVRENLHIGDTDAPIIPTLNVLQHAKKEAINKDLGAEKMKDKDLIQTIYRLNFENPYKGCYFNKLLAT